MSTTTLRRCIGSTRFGIEAHETAVEDFPTQPSQPDGLGRMCKPHWGEYTAGLRKDALARKAAGDGPPADGSSTRSKATGRKAGKAITKALTGTPTTRARKPRPPSAKASEVERAEALIAEVDALPAPEMVERIGADDVQVALEVSAAARQVAE